LQRKKKKKPGDWSLAIKGNQEALILSQGKGGELKGTYRLLSQRGKILKKKEGE